MGRLGRSDDAGAASRRMGKISQVRTKGQGTPLRHVNSEFFQKPQIVQYGGMKGSVVPGKAVRVDKECHINNLELCTKGGGEQVKRF